MAINDARIVAKRLLDGPARVELGGERRAELGVRVPLAGTAIVVLAYQR